MAAKCLLLQQCRSISTTSWNYGKRNFRKFPLYNKRGTNIQKQRQLKYETRDPDLFYNRGVRETGYVVDSQYHEVPEMIPELMVPDLTGFKLKPYVSYRVTDVVQGEFTAKDLFDVVYSEKILLDFKNAKIDENGQPIEPSSDEMLTPEEAQKRARQTGTDIFAHSPPPKKNRDM